MLFWFGGVLPPKQQPFYLHSTPVCSPRKKYVICSMQHHSRTFYLECTSKVSASPQPEWLSGPLSHQPLTLFSFSVSWEELKGQCYGSSETVSQISSWHVPITYYKLKENSLTWSSSGWGPPVSCRGFLYSLHCAHILHSLCLYCRGRATRTEDETPGSQICPTSPGAPD